MHPRSRIRGREPPSSGGRYRRRSPPPLPPPSPRPPHHQQRRARDPLPPPRRSSPERPRRLDEKPLPPPPAALVVCAERRWRTDVLLEAGRLAAHYLVAQGVLPEHVLHAREDPSPKQHQQRADRPLPVPGLALVGEDGDGDERILVRTGALREPCMAALLEMAAQQFGYGQPGVLRIPCDGRQFQRMVSAMCSKSKAK